MPKALPCTDQKGPAFQPVKSPVSNPGLVMRFAEAGWVNDKAEAAVRASRSLVGAFMPDCFASSLERVGMEAPACFPTNETLHYYASLESFVKAKWQRMRRPK